MDAVSTGHAPAGQAWWVGGHQIIAHLSTGGMGEVYLGRSAGGRPAAVKLVHPHLADDPEFRTRFAREVAAASRVSGAFTAPIVGSDTTAPVPWLATAYIAGPSLAEAVRAAGALPEPVVRTLAAGLVEALAAVHAAGITHRDLSPRNVLLSSSGPRIIDFGVAASAEATALTRTGQTVGTPGYMPPEQAEGGTATAAGDVFSLGALLAFAATGREPYGSGSAAAVVYRILHQAPDLDGIPPGLHAVLERCTAKDPDARPALDELLGLFGGHDAALRPAGLPPAVHELIRHQEETARRLLHSVPAAPPPAPAPAARRRPRWVLPLAAAGAALVLGAAAFTVPLLLPGDGGGQDAGAAAPESAGPQRFGDLEAPPAEPAAEPAALPAFTPAGKAVDIRGVSIPRHIAYSADGELIYVKAREGPVVAVDAETGKKEFTTEFKGAGPLAVSTGGDPLLAVADSDGDRVVVADGESGKELREIDGIERTGFSAVAFTAKGELIVSNDSEGTRVWDPSTGEQTGTLSPVGGEHLAVSSDGSLYAVGNTHEGIEVRTTGGNKVAGMDVDKAGNQRLAFQPGTTMLATYEGDAVRFWDAATGKALDSRRASAMGRSSLAFHPDGGYLLTWAADAPVVFDADARTEIGEAELPLPPDANTRRTSADSSDGFAFSPDGTRMAGLGLFDTLYIWKVG